MAETRLLFTSVGVGPYERTQFVMEDGRKATAAISPIAFADLLNVDSMLLAHTAAIRTDTDYIDRISEACADRDINFRRVEVPLVEDRTNVDQILDRVGAELLRADAEIVSLDVTHAFRSLQLAFYTTATHLNAVDVVDLEHIYYSEDAGHGGTASVVDLSYLATLMEWHHALRSFRSDGTLRPLQRLLETKRNLLFRQGGEHPELVQLTKALNSVASNLDAGLPLETGVAARDAVNKIRALSDRDFVGPEGAFLNPLADQLEQFAVNQQKVNEKTDIDLTAGELRRQRDLVQFYLDTGREWIALECARELFLTRLLYDPHRHDVNWLESDVRHETKDALTSAAKQYHSEDARTPEALSVWNELSDYRNKHAHAGFDTDNTPMGVSVRSVIETVCDRLTDDSFWDSILPLDE